MAAEPPAHADVISQLQEQVNALCAKLFNFLGALQRDAPPVSIKGEGLLAPTGGIDVQVRSQLGSKTNRPLAALLGTMLLPWLQAQTELMANELLEGFTGVERLIQQLPATDKTEEQQVQEIVTLQEHNSRASQELQGELQAAEAQLAQLQEAYGMLADLQLARLRRQQQQQQQQQQEPGG
jgi:hypothetical protein